MVEPAPVQVPGEAPLAPGQMSLGVIAAQLAPHRAISPKDIAKALAVSPAHAPGPTLSGDTNMQSNSEQTMDNLQGQANVPLPPGPSPVSFALLAQAIERIGASLGTTSASLSATIGKLTGPAAVSPTNNPAVPPEAALPGLAFRLTALSQQAARLEVLASQLAGLVA